jgi:NAD(P)-dependent dehydrogenase (short-subunit alcohol dehydrogenase family)
LSQKQTSICLYVQGSKTHGHWCEIPHMENPKNAIVIGGTDGVGKEIACGLAKIGCTVLIVGRDAEKAGVAVSDIKHKTGNQNIHYLITDLALMSEANNLANHIITHFNQLHYLIHSAGILLNRRVITAEGIETNFAVNYLSRFVITNRLLPLLVKGGKSGRTAKILIISGAVMGGKIHWEDVNLSNNFGFTRFIAQQCQANDLFTIELARRLRDNACSSVCVNIIKLGVVKTNIRKSFPYWMKWLVYLVFDPLLGQSPEEAAAAALKILLDSRYEYGSGKLFLKIRGLKEAIPSKTTRDNAFLNKMWQLSWQLIAKTDAADPQFN